MEWYSMKSLRPPKQMKELLPFENKFIELVRNMKFRKTRSNFQKKIQDGIKVIRTLNKTITLADKTSNINCMLTNAICTTYKKTDSNIKSNISQDGRLILKNKTVLNCMEINRESNYFLVLLNPPTTDQPTTNPPTKQPADHRSTAHRLNNHI